MTIHSSLGKHRPELVIYAVRRHSLQHSNTGVLYNSTDQRDSGFCFDKIDRQPIGLFRPTVNKHSFSNLVSHVTFLTTKHACVRAWETRIPTICRRKNSRQIAVENLNLLHVSRKNPEAQQSMCRQRTCSEQAAPISKPSDCATRHVIVDSSRNIPKRVASFG